MAGRARGVGWLGRWLSGSRGFRGVRGVLVRVAGSCVAVGLGWLVLLAAPAFAQLNESLTFGSSGSGAGQLSSPQGVAVDQSSGDVYVVDAGNFRVEKFDAQGKFVLAFGAGVDHTTGGSVCTAASGDTCGAGTAGAGPGAFETPQFVAVDNSSGPSAGDVYVGEADPADTQNDLVVSKFDSGGNLLSAWESGGQLNGWATFGAINGLAVDASGNLFVIDAAGLLWEYAQNGTQVGDVIGGPPNVTNLGLAIDSGGNFYKVNLDGSVEKLNSAGNNVATVAGAGGDTQIALDPSSGDLYVDTGTAVGAYVFDPSGNVLEGSGPACTPALGSGCAPTYTLESLTNGTGLAFDPTVTITGAPSAGALYVADQSTNDVTVFVPSAPAAPTVIREGASSVTTTSATVSATVNANGFDTHYYFEYVDAAGYNPSAPDPYSAGTELPAPPGTDLGAYFDGVGVSVTPTGLDQSTVYHFRVVASNSLGTTYGSDQTFETYPSAPSVDSQSSTNITLDSATLNAQINPNLADTTYYFEYVDAAGYKPSASDPYSAGSKVPAPPGSDIGSETADQSETANVAGLAATTTYHWRTVAVNAVGTAYGPDQTFETFPVAPSVDSQSSAGITSDTATLNALINPDLADTTYYFEYVDDAAYNASASDPYSAGSKVPVPPGADIGSSYGDQAASANLSGLAASTGYHWRTVAVNAVGTVYAPDQTFTTATPAAPSVDSQAAASVTSDSATVSAQINPELADTTYYFEYVDNAGYKPSAVDPYSAGSRVPLPPGTDIGSSYGDEAAPANLSGLAASTGYHWRTVAVNAVGTVYGGDETFTTATPLAPGVDSQSSASITSDAATLDAQIDPNFAETAYYFEYVDDAGYNPSAADPYSAGSEVPAPPGIDIGSSNVDQAVSASLTGLAATTTYHWRTVAVNAVGTTDGPDQTFTTYPAAPRVDGESVSGVTFTSATLNAQINPRFGDTHYYFEYVDSAGYRRFAPDPYRAGAKVPLPPGTEIGSADTDQAASVIVSGLKPGTTYHYRVVAVNAIGTAYGRSRTFTTIADVTVVGAFGKATIDAASPSVSELWLRNPDGSLPQDSIVAGGGADTSSITSSSGAIYTAASATPARVTVQRNAAGAATGVTLSDIQVIPGVETETWTFRAGASLEWTIRQHWRAGFSGSAEAEPAIPLGSTVYGTWWYDPTHVYAPENALQPVPVYSPDDYDVVTDSNTWLVDKIYSPDHFGSDMRFAIKGGYLTQASQAMGATFKPEQAFSVAAGVTRSLSVSIAPTPNQDTGQQLAVKIGDPTMQSELENMYGTMLNGGSVAGQASYLLGNQNHGFNTAYEALFAGVDLGAGVNTGAISARPFSFYQGFRSYLSAILASVDSHGYLTYGVAGDCMSGCYQDESLNALMGLYYYTVATGDLTLFEQEQGPIEAILGKWLAEVQPDGLVVNNYSDGNYYDSVGFGSQFTMLIFDDEMYETLRQMAELDGVVAAQHTAQAEVLKNEAAVDSQTADRIKQGINTVLWSPNSPHGPMYTDWIDYDTNTPSYTFMPGQWAAIVYGIASPQQAKEILATADKQYAALTTNCGYTGEATLTMLWPPAPGGCATAANENGLPYAEEVGGMLLYATYYEVMARAETGDTAGATTLLKRFATRWSQTAWYGNNGFDVQGQPIGDGEPYLADMEMTPAALVQGILGIQESWDQLTVTPALPAGWSHVSAVVTYKGKPVCVTINSAGSKTQVRTATLTGNPTECQP